MISPSTVDLSDRLNLADCRAEWERAERQGDDATKAMWGDKWARAAIGFIEDPTNDEDSVRIANLEADLDAEEIFRQEAESEVSAFEKAIRIACRSLRGIAAGVTDDTKLFSQIEDIIDALENA